MAENNKPEKQLIFVKFAHDIYVESCSPKTLDRLYLNKMGFSHLTVTIDWKREVLAIRSQTQEILVPLAQVAQLTYQE
jgi:hypothetical protein